MKKKKNGLARGLALTLIVFALVFGGAVALVQNIGASSEAMEEELVLQAVRSAALTCYAIEGAYPPDLQYLRDYYGIRYDRSRYVVSYDAFASNLMPEIRVMIRGQQ